MPRLLAKRCRISAIDLKEISGSYFEGMKPAPSPERQQRQYRTRLTINAAIQSGLTASGRDALERMLEQAGANSFANQFSSVARDPASRQGTGAGG